MKSPALFVTAVVLAATTSAGCAGGALLGLSASLPPPLLGPAPSELVVLPGTDIYAAPSHRADLYFVDGWWWRSWNGNWYRSERYGRDWRYFAGTPYFAPSIPGDWRSHYQRREWRGRPQKYDRVPRDEALSHWDQWKREGRWTRDHDRDEHEHDHEEARSGDRLDENNRRDDSPYEEVGSRPHR